MESLLFPVTTSGRNDFTGSRLSVPVLSAAGAPMLSVDAETVSRPFIISRAISRMWRRASRRLPYTVSAVLVAVSSGDDALASLPPTEANMGRKSNETATVSRYFNLS